MKLKKTAEAARRYKLKRTIIVKPTKEKIMKGRWRRKDEEEEEEEEDI